MYCSTFLSFYFDSVCCPLYLSCSVLLLFIITTLSFHVFCLITDFIDFLCWGGKGCPISDTPIPVSAWLDTPASVLRRDLLPTSCGHCFHPHSYRIIFSNPEWVSVVTEWYSGRHFFFWFDSFNDVMKEIKYYYWLFHSPPRRYLIHSPTLSLTNLKTSLRSRASDLHLCFFSIVLRLCIIVDYLVTLGKKKTIHLMCWHSSYYL